jgi:ABC-2 type transport system ATP-binding protein
MTAVVEVTGVTKRYGSLAALDDVSLTVRENTICGLLGRNGAGKTTLMHVLTGQDVVTSGRVEIFGQQPYENAAVLRRVCCIKESQAYPDNYKVHHVLKAAALLLPHWDEAYAATLVDDFQLPPGRLVKKLSRGMRSALGVVLGLASRAPLTFLDEPYLGLDAVARQLFYDRLLADYAEHPRTVVLSTHLIDEVSHLLEQVVVLDGGRIVVDSDAETLRARAVTITGPARAVEEFTGMRQQLHSERLGGFARVTVPGPLTDDERSHGQRQGLSIEPVSLQQLVVHTTTTTEKVR